MDGAPGSGAGGGRSGGVPARRGREGRHRLLRLAQPGKPRFRPLKRIADGIASIETNC